MRYHDRGLNVAYLPVNHPFVVLTQNCGVIVKQRSADGKTATVVSILSAFDRFHTSSTEVLYSDLKF